MFTQARALYRASEHHYLHALCAFQDLRWLLLTYRADRLAEGQQRAREAEEALKLAANAGGVSFPRIARAPLAFVQGRWDELRADALAVLDETEVRTPWRDNAMAMLGLVAYAQGDTVLTWSRIDEALPDGPLTPPGDSYFTTGIEMQHLASMLTIASGDLDTARSWLEAHDRWLAWSGAVIGRSEAQGLWARYYHASGERVQAKQHAERALQHATEPRQPLALLAAHRLLGELATEASRYEDARTHLDESLALADACAAPYERALTLLALAELHIAQRHVDEARTAISEARTICETLGAKPTLARADALAARLDAVAKQAPAYPAGLSEREVEVLRLLAVGKTNREIADALYLSEHTVRVHVRNILTKTATDNRTAAAAFARDCGIA